MMGHKPITSDTLSDAREGLKNALAREKEAETALSNSREAVKDASKRIGLLEEEATKEHRLAQAKMKEAKSIRKQTGKLGRR